MKVSDEDGNKKAERGNKRMTMILIFLMKMRLSPSLNRKIKMRKIHYWWMGEICMKIRQWRRTIIIIEREWSPNNFLTNVDDQNVYLRRCGNTEMRKFKYWE